jgi:hypothetical protein
MKPDTSAIDTLYKNTDTDSAVLQDSEVAHIVLERNKVLGMNTVPGLDVDVQERADGIDATITVKEGVIIHKTVHLCFGVLPKTGIQRIIMKVNVGKNARISVLAHCIFPNATDVQHIMDGTINIAEGGHYSYLEKHVHSPHGGIKVYPKAVIHVGKGGMFRTEFELIKGRVGLIDIDYETTCDADGILEMTTRVSGRADDIIKVQETGNLVGERARGVLTSKIAVREHAKAEIYNKLIATAAYARGHVDCKEIVQDQGVATATPIVEVNHPKAHITHEAAIGSVDKKQLETLLARGLSEDEAVELIIQGLLS